MPESSRPVSPPWPGRALQMVHPATAAWYHSSQPGPGRPFSAVRRLRRKPGAAPALPPQACARKCMPAVLHYVPGAGPGWHANIVLDGQRANQPPILRHIADAQQRAPMPRHVHEVGTIEPDDATRNGEKPHDTLECSGFAGAIASDQRHQPPCGDLQTDTTQNTKTFDRDADTIHLQHGYSRPRTALRTSG